MKKLLTLSLLSLFASGGLLLMIIGALSAYLRAQEYAMPSAICAAGHIRGPQEYRPG